ncbi:MAG: DEAD/DEAH box helicase [Syntrophomonadaceae bacterium]|nr:DEAD/DEAH box helicase [Syntrophomonadaceae bacterium]
MFAFQSRELEPVWSDFAVINHSYIHAISIVGPEIGIKAYRAMLSRASNFRLGRERVYTSSQYQLEVRSRTRTDQGYQIILINPGLIIAFNQDEMHQAMYRHLIEIDVPAPSPREPIFKECMDRVLERAVNAQYFRRPTIMTTLPEMDTAHIYLPQEELKYQFREQAAEEIAQFIPSPASPDNLFAGIEGVADYIEKYSNEIGNKVADQVEYLHTPGDYSKELLDKCPRPLFPQQADITAAGSKTLDRLGHVIVMGEMGVGKTAIGAAMCYYHAQGKPFRAIVTCPSHLLNKWKREIKEVVPDAKTKVFVEKDGKKPWQHFFDQWKESTDPETPEYWIVSNETLRGGYIQKPGFTIKRRKRFDPELEERVWADLAACPGCGSILMYRVKKRDEEIWMEMTPDDFKNHNTRNHQCFRCGEPLWQADGERKGYRKISVGDIIKKLIPKGFFDYYIADEAHQYKNATAQGMAFGGVISKANYTIAMTGTLADGYAQGLYFLLWRLCPALFKKMRYRHNESSRARFQKDYGFWIQKSRVRESSEYGTTSRNKYTRPILKPLPGYTIDAFPKFLLERTIFLRLSDVAPYLPPKTEYVNLIEMDEDLQENYRDIYRKFYTHIREGGPRVASQMLHTCLSYPDHAKTPSKITLRLHDPISITIPPLDKNKLYNKEIALQEILQSELELGRKCLIFSTYSNIKDCLPRIEYVVNGVPGADPIVLRSNTVRPACREAWVQERFDEGANCLICHPALVETGLDLYDCVTIIWLQTGYVPSTIRQASSRSWRIGQKEPVKIIFLAYKDTLQETCFQLVGKKLNAAGLLEGDITNEGLRNFGADDTSFSDVISIVTDNIKIENADDIFEAYKPEVARMLHVTKEEEIDETFLPSGEIRRHTRSKTSLSMPLVTLADLIEEGRVEVPKRQLKKIKGVEQQLLLPFF